MYMYVCAYALVYIHECMYIGMSPSKITLSTVGIVPRIRQITKEMPQISLAVSLHAPNQALRSEIMPAGMCPCLYICTCMCVCTNICVYIYMCVCA